MFTKIFFTELLKIAFPKSSNFLEQIYVKKFTMKIAKNFFPVFNIKGCPRKVRDKERSDVNELFE